MLNWGLIIESSVPKEIREDLEELQLYHGSQADFDNFDLAYLSTGWGQQAYGYGFYLTTSKEAASEYAKGGKMYTVEIPDGKYLSYEKRNGREFLNIARKFFKYYTTEDEYGKDAYRGNENEFWEYECKYIADCQNGGYVYGTLSSIIGDDKATSEFLNRLGYVGIEWKGNNAATNETFFNYVIFNPNDIKIVSKE